MTNYVATTHLIEKKALAFERIIFRGCQIASILSAIYLVTGFITGDLGGQTSQEFILSLLQCFLGVGVLYVPALVMKVTGIELPDPLCSFFYIFVLCGTVLGEVFSLYYVIPHWDSLLHFSSGIMAGMLGGILIAEFLQKKQCEKLILPMVIVISVICFATCVGAIWEIYEFVTDSLFGVNMQKWMLQDGTSLVGRAALVDTMKDIIVDIAGAIVAAISACLSLKQEKGWFYSYLKPVFVKVPQKFVDRKATLPYSA